MKSLPLARVHIRLELLRTMLFVFLSFITTPKMR